MKITLPVVLAVAMSTAEARRYHTSSGRVVVPRSSFQRDLESSFDFVGEILSSGPMNTLANTLLKENGFHIPSMPTPATTAPQYAVSTDDETGVTTLRVELPGVSAQDLEVILENDSLLRIQGKRHHLTGQTMEFDQSFQLDKDVDASSLQVTLQNGTLQVTASKKAKSVQRLEVKTTTAALGKKETVTIAASTEQEGEEDLTITEEE